MDTVNLIKLGAFAQRYFDLEENFEIVIWMGKDNYIKMPIIDGRFPYIKTSDSERSLASEIEIEDIQLEQFMIGQFVRMAYSKRLNKLIVKFI